MSDAADHWLSSPRSLSEELFARPDELKIFISSQMRGGVLAFERIAAAEAVERIPSFARAWYWERDADAGPYCSEPVCLGHAATSDGLILILGRELTPVTRREYEIAYARGVATYIFLDQRVEPDAGAKAFIDQERDHAITKGFKNASELQTHILESLMRFSVGAIRRTNFATAHARRAARGRRAL